MRYRADMRAYERHRRKQLVPEMLEICEDTGWCGFEARRLASHYGIDPRTIQRLIKQETGLSITQLKHASRIGAAKKLLRRTRHTTDEIAALTGWRSRSYFCRLFKQVVGVSPSEYRGQRRKRSKKRRSD